MNQIEKIIDIATWNRREHYEHFSAFDDPFFGVPIETISKMLGHSNIKTTQIYARVTPK